MIAPNTALADEELVLLLADNPELLAIADAVAGTRPPRERARALSAALVAAALAAVAVAAVALFGTGGSTSLVERARAAIGTAPVLHAVTELPTGTSIVNVQTGERRSQTLRTEIWFDRARGLEHVRTAVDGTVTSDVLKTPDATFTEAGPFPASAGQTTDQALRTFVEGYPTALARGEARELRRGELDGKAAIWVELTDGNRTDHVVLDATTYRPLQVSPNDGTPTYRIVQIETVDRPDADFTKPTATLAGKRAGSGGRIERIPLRIEHALDELPAAVWAGPNFAGHDASFEADTLRTIYDSDGVPAHSGTGIAVTYAARNDQGNPDFTRPFVQIWQAADREVSYGWLFVRGPDPAPGELLLTGNQGFLVRRGLHVTIRASTPDLVLRAARALMAIRS